MKKDNEHLVADLQKLKENNANYVDRYTRLELLENEKCNIRYHAKPGITITKIKAKRRDLNI